MQSALRWSRLLYSSLFFLCTILLLSCDLHAQNSTSTLRGVVEDPSGRRVVGAQVVVRLTGSGSSIAREATANERGEFRIDGLLPGPYQVAVTAKGFAEATADVDIGSQRGARYHRYAETSPAGHETVNVQGKSSSITTETIDTSSAVRGGVVAARTWKLFRSRHAASPTSLIWCPEPSRSSLPILPRRASPPSPPAEAPA